MLSWRRSTGAWWVQKQGYAPSTCMMRFYKIKQLARLGADLLNPESVKDIIARQTGWSDGTKHITVIVYSSFLEMLGLTWDQPRYRAEESIPFIPLESEIDALINGCGRRMACFLQGLKDTGAGPGELARLEWTDVNYEAKSVTIRHPVKGHRPRVVPVSGSFLGRLNAIPKVGSRVFCTIDGLRRSFEQQRRRIVHNLSNPRLLRISFQTLRHWKGTMEYHRTKDIIHVQGILGHKTIQSTMIYINLEAALFDERSDQFHVRVARTVDEASRLIEAGFEKVDEMEGLYIYRKRK